MRNFRAVILAGGSGERFWPLSTSAKPKQFLDVFGGDTLIRQSFLRLKGLCRAEDVHVVTALNLVRTTRKELSELPAANIVGEPMRRDTGAAVALGVGLATAGDEENDPVIGIFSSDQLVAHVGKFRAAVKAAIRLALKEDEIVTIGIRPSWAATGYGYVNPATGTFVEKPKAEVAERYVKAGYLWNAGMFIARASVFRAAFGKHAPELMELATAERKMCRGKRLVAMYEKLPRLSFDYAVMEKVGRVGVIAGDFGWDDVGSYGAFDRYYPHDRHGNVASGDVQIVEGAGNICIARGAKLAVLGVKDVVVVTTKDAVLVTNRAHVGELKKLFQNQKK